MVKISSVKFAFFWKRESEEYQISVGTVEGSLVQFSPDGAPAMGWALEKLSHLSGQWLNSLDCVLRDRSFKPEGNNSASVDYLSTVVSFVAAVLEKGAPLKGIGIDLLPLVFHGENAGATALGRSCVDLVGRLMDIRSVRWASMRLWSKADLARLDSFRTPPPLTELVLHCEFDEGQLFDLLNSLSGSLERLCLEDFEPGSGASIINIE